MVNDVYSVRVEVARNGADLAGFNQEGDLSVITDAASEFLVNVPIWLGRFAPDTEGSDAGMD